MYRRCLKRLLDFFLSLVGLLALSPFLLLLCLTGAVAMRGNPFFTQVRPGKNERLFHLVKFRTMARARGEDGKPLADEARLNAYGRLLRRTSLDELPELFNVLLGQMSLVGPRPLLPEYLPYYTDEERLRHSVRPGLTGLAQVNGRNAIASWEERFAYDLRYVRECSLLLDLKILLATVGKVVRGSGIQMGDQLRRVGRLDDARRKVATQAGSVMLRPFAATDIPAKVRWVNDPANHQYLHYELPLEEQKTRAWWERASLDPTRYDAVIELDGRAVGLCGLLSIGDAAELYVMLGEQDCKRLGVATAAIRLLLHKAFSGLDLARVYLYTEVENLAAQALFSRVGFVREDLLAANATRNGQPVDRYLYGMERAKWKDT